MPFAVLASVRSHEGIELHFGGCDPPMRQRESYSENLGIVSVASSHSYINSLRARKKTHLESRTTKTNLVK